MKLDQIFLDVDDVCNIFTMYALRLVGCPVSLSDHEYPVQFPWNIVGAANHLHPTRKFTETEFWDSISADDWAKAPKSPEYTWLLGRCVQLVGRGNVCFLTSTTKSPAHAAGKLDWIQRNSPSWMHRDYLIGPPKEKVARPGCLLIDDREKNVMQWRKKGGEAILVPRAWNNLRHCNPLTEISYHLDRYRNAA